MIPVSADYNPFPPVRHVGIGVSFGVIDLTAKPGATVSSSEDGAIARLRQTIDDQTGVTAKYAALEPGLWRLDGSFSVLPDNLAPVETGWWSSSVSGADGTFSSAPWVQYTFSGAVSTIGWDLYFDAKANQYPTQILVTLYNQDGSERSEHSFSASGAVQYLELSAEDYWGVKFTFLQTSEPYRRVRFLEVVFGHSEVFDANSVGRVSLLYELDPLSETFPSRQIDFVFDNSDKKYNLLSPEGLYEYLQDGQHIDASISIDGEPVHMGSFYFTSASVSDNVITPAIQGNDIALLSLDEGKFTAGSGDEMTLSEAAALVLAGADISVRFDGDTGERTVIPALQSVSQREALRMLAQAAMCSVRIDRYGVLCFTELSIADEPADELTPNELYDFTGVSVAEPVDMAEVVVKNPFLEDSEVVYTAGSGKNIKSITNPCVAPSMGDAVAAWVLTWANRRKRYAVKNRCNPAVDLGDTLQIHDLYGNRGLAVVTSIEIEYSGGLSAVTGGVGQ